MEITNLPNASTAAAATQVTKTAARAKMQRSSSGAMEVASASDAAPAPAVTRGPKVLQSRQARQRCLEFSRG